MMRPAIGPLPASQRPDTALPNFGLTMTTVCHWGEDRIKEPHRHAGVDTV